MLNQLIQPFCRMTTGCCHCSASLQLPFYTKAVNLAWCGLSAALLLSVGLLAAIMFGQDRGTIDPEVMTWVSIGRGSESRLCLMAAPVLTCSAVSAASKLLANPPALRVVLLQALLYGIFPAIALGAAWGWVRTQAVNRLSAKVRHAFEELSVETVLAGESAASASGMLSRRKTAGALALGRRTTKAARASQGAPKGASVVALLADLKAVHRWRDVRQVSLVLREMRVWDEDGVPDA
jgi:hypothetical protein